MSALRLDYLLDFLSSRDFFLGILWLGLTSVTVTLSVMMVTRWGQYHVVRKCLTLSIVAHLLLAGYSTTLEIAVGPLEESPEPPIRVSINEEDREKSDRSDEETRNRSPQEKPWESFVEEPKVRPELSEMVRIEPPENHALERQKRADQVTWNIDRTLDHLPLASAAQTEPESLPAQEIRPTPRLAREAEPIEAPAAQRRNTDQPAFPVQPELNREGYAHGPIAKSTRRTQAGTPSSLLEQAVRVPRLDDTPVLAGEPGEMLAGEPDLDSSPRRGQPAEPYAAPAPPNAASEGAGEPEGRPLGPASDPLKPPSIAMRGGSGGSGGNVLDPTARQTPGIGPQLLPVRRRGASDHQVPEVYKLRVAPDRSRLAERQGATPDTEKAVKAALKWLAGNQESDGRWSARRHGAGYETRTAGRDRQGAGAQADTGMTGLALLALLASGHTHREGDYNTNVRRGLQYLLGVQRSDGGLGGDAANFEYNYCHAMATLALSEAYGMTGDPALAAPVRRAIEYTLANQNATSGGWRYNPWDPGDTSQLGWQLMSLKSAELAGISLPEKARAGVVRFLDSVSSGPHRGLAAYRTGEAVTRPMTAEALMCRQLLGLNSESPKAREAGDYLLEQLPGRGEDNVYYWYYGTLAMYQLQGIHWQRWNEALQRKLVASQITSGASSGTWDPDRVWGGYGGRVYSTALSALCLEVYYRYLPLYLQAGQAGSND
jgi:hypothetical protein